MFPIEFHVLFDVFAAPQILSVVLRWIRGVFPGVLEPNCGREWAGDGLGKIAERNPTRRQYEVFATEAVWQQKTTGCGETRDVTHRISTGCDTWPAGLVPLDARGQ